MQLDARIFVAGHRGLVGSAIVRNLQGNCVSATSKSEGTPRKLPDVSPQHAQQRQPKVSLRESIAEARCRFRQHQNELHAA